MAVSWYPAVVNSPAQASQINQFLTTHSAQFLYTGVAGSSNATATGTATSATWLAQPFSGVSSLGRVVVPLSINGTPGMVTMGIYSGTTPTTALMLASVPVLPAAASVSVPFPLTLSNTTTYWIVMQALGTSSDGWAWTKGSSASGAYTSTNGTSWTSAGYSLGFTCYDQTASGLVVGIVYDANPQSRWFSFDYASGELATIRDSVGGTLGSTASLAYTSGQLTTVTAA